MEMAQNHKVQIHLKICQDNETIHVEFPFDTEEDNIDQVVEELIANCKLTEEESEQIKQKIQEQIDLTKNGSFQKIPNLQNQMEPIETTIEPLPSNFEPIPDVEEELESSDGDVMSDPEYQKLLQKQKEEILQLEEKHRLEKLHLTQPSGDDLIVFS